MRPIVPHAMARRRAVQKRGRHLSVASITRGIIATVHSTLQPETARVRTIGSSAICRRFPTSMTPSSNTSSSMCVLCSRPIAFFEAIVEKSPWTCAATKDFRSKLALRALTAHNRVGGTPCHSVGRYASTDSPPSGRFFNITSPPCPRMMFRATLNPRPAPPVSLFRDCSSR